jgi:hypothetical protein
MNYLELTLPTPSRFTDFHCSCLPLACATPPPAITTTNAQPTRLPIARLLNYWKASL